MRIACFAVALAAGACLLVSGAPAQEKAQEKEVTLKGDVMCAKCALKEAKTCQNAIQVKDGSKLVTYLFNDKGSAETYHEEVCGGEKLAATVIGKLAEKDGKKWITPSKVTYDKK